MYWLWGGFSVDNPTLNRFYSFHYTLPFILAGLSVFHIAALHQYGSTNPLGVNSQSSTLAFGTYFGAKDLVGALFLSLVFSILVFFYPDLLGLNVAVLIGNNYYYDIAICWNYLLVMSTQIISVFELQYTLVPYLVKISDINTYNSVQLTCALFCSVKGKSAGNQPQRFGLGSSETTRDMSYSTISSDLNFSDAEINSWFAGFTDSDGCLGIFDAPLPCPADMVAGNGSGSPSGVPL
jgi:Cytochrome b/b6/petB